MRTSRPSLATPAAVTVALLALGVVTAACSSTPSGSPSTTSTTSSPATTTSVPSSSTTTSGGSTTTTTTAVLSTCVASGLQFSVTGGNGAAGQLEETVVMANSSGTTCELGGYPGMQLFDSAGSTIPTNVVRGGVTFGVAAANQPAAVVTLKPGQSAAFTLHYEDVPVNGETSCPQSSTAEITPPNDTVPASVSLQIDPCDGGTVHVSPVYPSS